jgi:glucoamylase
MDRRPLPIPLLLAALLAALPAAAATAVPAAPAPTPSSLDAFFDGRGASASAVSSESLGQWLERERSIALKKMLANVSPPGAVPGSVAASPSHANPDYWYNWRRDAALTMQEVVSLYEKSSDPAQKAAYLKILNDYASFVKKEQAAAPSAPAGLGEPKYNMDGTPYTGPWGRPQDDSPAEEAGALIALARLDLEAGREDQARALYGDFAAGIKADLEYVSHRWPETSFDVWEEVKAHHLDTQVAQRDALREGAWLARRLGDGGAAKWYDAQAAKLEKALGRFWDPEKGYLVSARDRDAGLDYKGSGLDAAVILAAIHRQSLDAEALPAGASYSATDPRVLATAQALRERFRAQYGVNGRGPGVAVGRYPEDRYFGGNPWVLLTAAFAQLDYMAAKEFRDRGEIPVTAEDLGFFRAVLGDAGAGLTAGTALQRGDALYAAALRALKADGDAELACVRSHANPDGSLSEQIDKNTGFMTSARDLTWNYASVLSALAARDALD